MAGFDLRVQTTPSGEVIARKLTRFADRLGDMSSLWDEMAEALHAVQERAFESEGSSSGARWHPLSPRYRTEKAARFPGKGILEATGRLRRSFSSGAQGNIFKATPGRMTWGTEVPYSVYHQHGTSRMPARPVLRFTGGDADYLARVAHQHLVDLGRKSL